MIFLGFGVTGIPLFNHEIIKMRNWVLIRIQFPRFAWVRSLEKFPPVRSSGRGYGGDICTKSRLVRGAFTTKPII